MPKHSVVTHDCATNTFPIPFLRLTISDWPLLRATGEFVCSIGDDDGVNPEIVAACNWASLNELDALTTDRYRVMYYWPRVRAANSGATKAGKLQNIEVFRQSEFVEQEAESKCVRTAGLSFERLPKVYLGIVKKNVRC